MKQNQGIRGMLDINKARYLGFPDGIPGGWNAIRKIHFVGHSMGAQIARYLQYLMSIDYFSHKDKPSTTKIDKSNYFASISGINGTLNGL